MFSESLKLWGTTRAASRRLPPVTALFILWNLGLVYQWSVDMFPWRSQVYWDEVLYDQFRVVPQQAFRDLRAKFSSPRRTARRLNALIPPPARFCYTK